MIVIVAMFASACAGAWETTSTPGADSTAAESPTTTQSLSVQTTTTAASSSTSTTTTLAGQWASAPVVISSYGVLGWWDGEEWVQQVGTDEPPVQDGDQFQVVRFGYEGEVVRASGLDTRCEISEVAEIRGVTVDKPGALGSLPDLEGVGVSAPWDIFPHDVQLLSDDGTYAAFAREVLAGLGMEVDSPRVKQLIRFDLDGDGVLEVVTVAETENPTLTDEPGHYSIIFLRRIVDGEVKTYIVEDSVHGDDRIPLTFGVAGVADLNGDGRMELVINWGYYEGSGIGVSEFETDELGYVSRIGSGCGV